MIKTRLTPIKFLYYKNWKAWWLFKCECGNEIERTLNTYRTGNTKSCGCLIRFPPEGHGRSRYDVGKKYNRLLLVERIRKRNSKGVSYIYYKCLCDCGKYTTVRGAQIRNGNTKSCGCLDIETTIKRNKDPLFIQTRNNTTNKRYKVKHWKTGQVINCIGSWEYGTVTYFNENKIDYLWQIPFDLKNTRYICDVYLPKKKLFVEIKGRWMKDAKRKFNKFKRLYPKLKVQVWDRQVLYKLGIIDNQGRRISHGGDKQHTMKKFGKTINLDDLK